MHVDYLFLFSYFRASGEFAEEVQHIPTVVSVSSIFGFLFGGQFGARIAADYYTRHNKLTIYKSVMHAQRVFQSAQTMGFVKYGSRWGWRTGLFAGLYRYLKTTPKVCY